MSTHVPTGFGIFRFAFGTEPWRRTGGENIQPRWISPALLRNLPTLPPRAHTLMSSGGSQRRVKQKREAEAEAVAASPASRHAAGVVPACRRSWEELSSQERQTAARLGFEQGSWDTRAVAGAGVPAPACSALVPPSASAAPTPEPPPRKRRASSAAALEEAEDASKPSAPPAPPPRRGRAVAAVGAAPAAAHTPGKAAASVAARAAAAAAAAAAAPAAAAPSAAAPAAAAPAAAPDSKPAAGHPLRTSMAFRRPASRKRGAAHLTSETI